MVAFMYLHGLLSSSNSKKGTMLKEVLKQFGAVYNPDFYPIGTQWEFEKMTISYLLEKVNTWVDYPDDKVILIGSSLGGLVATRFMQEKYESRENVAGLILLAPAFNYYKILEAKTKPEDRFLWQKQGFIPVKHSLWKNQTKLSWEFVEDLKQHHSNINIPLAVPILLIHGDADNEIPVENSKQFAVQQRALGTIIEEYYLPDGEHNLLNKFDLLTQNTLAWLNNNGFIK